MSFQKKTSGKAQPAAGKPAAQKPAQRGAAGKPASAQKAAPEKTKEAGPVEVSDAELAFYSAKLVVNGRVAKTPELKTFGDDGKRVSLHLRTLAEGAQGDIYSTNHFLTCFGEAAEVASELEEGTFVRAEADVRVKKVGDSYDTSFIVDFGRTGILEAVTAPEA